MDLEYRPTGTLSYIVSAIIAAVTTAAILWLIFTVADDYYATGEQVAAAQASSVAHAHTNS
jgi:hypothetical protein